MENEVETTRQFWTTTAKVNSFLLLVLIILMGIAIGIMLDNKATYLPFL
jgi:uncharacterized membrane protein